MKHKCTVAAIAVFFLSVAFAGLCADAGFQSDNEFGEWMTFYYQDPTPEKVPTALTYFCNSALYKSNATIPMVAFFSALFKKDAGLMQKTFDDISLHGSEEAKIMLINILFLTNNMESKTVLEKAKSVWQSERLQNIIARQMARPHDDLYSMPVDSPLMLDMLWASFFATGDALPVQRIISALHLRKEGKGEEMLVGSAADWSLKSNVQQHPKVMEICKNELANAQGITKEMLKSVIYDSAK